MGRVAPPIPRSRASLLRRLGADPSRLRSVILVTIGALLVTVGVHRELVRADAERRRWGDTRAVWVVTAPVSSGGSLRDRGHTVRWPAAVVPATALATLPDGARAALALSPGMILTDSLLRAAGSTATSAGPAGTGRDQTVVAVPLGPARPALRRGLGVDVWATYDPTLAGGRAATRRVATHATVVGVDARSASVAVDSDEVPDVVAAAATATVTLALVGPDG